MNDNMAAGAIEVVKNNPKYKNMLAYGVNGTAEALLLIKDSVENACDNLVKRKSIQYPDISIRKVYEEYYKLYKKLYDDLQESYKVLSRLPQ